MELNTKIMKNLTLPVLSKKFIVDQGKTVVECNHNGAILSVWVPGDRTMDNSLLCNVTINEVGDTFVATKDSKTIENGKPLYVAGETVTRAKQSVEFKSFTGNNSAAQFAQSAAAFNLQLNVIMQ